MALDRSLHRLRANGGENTERGANGGEEKQPLRFLFRQGIQAIAPPDHLPAITCQRYPRDAAGSGRWL
jgi:hypothetical protein